MNEFHPTWLRTCKVIAECAVRQGLIIVAQNRQEIGKENIGIDLAILHNPFENCFSACLLAFACMKVHYKLRKIANVQTASLNCGHGVFWAQRCFKIIAVCEGVEGENAERKYCGVHLHENSQQSAVDLLARRLQAMKERSAIATGADDRDASFEIDLSQVLSQGSSQ